MGGVLSPGFACYLSKPDGQAEKRESRWEKEGCEGEREEREGEPFVLLTMYMVLGHKADWCWAL